MKFTFWHKVFFPRRLEHEVPWSFHCVCVHTWVCVCESVCVYVCSHVQCSLEDGDRLPWQQLESWVNCSDICVCVYKLALVFSQAEARQGRSALVVFIAHHTDSESLKKTSLQVTFHNVNLILWDQNSDTFSTKAASRVTDIPFNSFSYITVPFKPERATWKITLLGSVNV